ncbi:hypothetical protein E4T38_01454 [Aureobasidium subglaciale]|nr:hypothetical protein E4T38_01454 [Aureobasidium subglaciale]KAI5229778.1 hypothetical protein E4T40_01455 [Aureobasidium subglaciale]KAI5233395.1 hypothetical protein E4T41_01452 [Aureobasidium subglaciale]KAI5266731.1 hypothetical protein E4T46_01454 [Aureobasidium subglaciale]
MDSTCWETAPMPSAPPESCWAALPILSVPADARAYRESIKRSIDHFLHVPLVPRWMEQKYHPEHTRDLRKHLEHYQNIGYSYNECQILLAVIQHFSSGDDSNAILSWIYEEFSLQEQEYSRHIPAEGDATKLLSDKISRLVQELSKPLPKPDPESDEPEQCQTLEQMRVALCRSNKIGTLAKRIQDLDDMIKEGAENRLSVQQGEGMASRIQALERRMQLTPPSYATMSNAPTPESTEEGHTNPSQKTVVNDSDHKKTQRVDQTARPPPHLYIPADTTAQDRATTKQRVHPTIAKVRPDIQHKVVADMRPSNYGYLDLRLKKPAQDTDTIAPVSIIPLELVYESNRDNPRIIGWRMQWPEVPEPSSSVIW